MSKARLILGAALTGVFCLTGMLLTLALNSSDVQQTSNDVNPQAQNRDALNTARSEAISDEAARREKLQQKIIFRRLVENALQNEANVDEFTFNEVHELTAPYFFEMAAEVLDEMYLEQPANDRWTAEVRESAEMLFDNAGVTGTEIHSIDCRDTLCKVEFAHDDGITYDSFMARRMNEGPWVAQAGEAFSDSVENNDGSIRSFVYFTNPGDQETFWEMRLKMAQQIIDSPS